MEKRLYRSESNRMIAGICGGIGIYFNIDATLVRLVFAGAFLLGFGSPGIIYLVLWILMPSETRMAGIAPDQIQEGVQKMANKARQVVDDFRTPKR